MELPSKNLFFSMAILISVSITCQKVTAADYDVTKYGAVGDGKTDDKNAFSQAWTAACGDSSNPSVIIPAGKTFFVSPLAFNGPCKSSSITVQVDGSLVAPQKSQWRAGDSAWIQFRDIDGLVVNGKGQFDGQGGSWWPQGGTRPKSLLFVTCNDLKLSGISSLNPPRNHISIVSCDGIDVSHIHLTAPEDSPNTDGIDISLGSNNNIHDSTIATGDDCIAIGGGISSLNITNVACGPGHGISVGSLGEGGKTDTVEFVNVAHCSFTNTQNGARIKTWKGGAGYAREITYTDITLSGVKNPIIIIQNYTDNSLPAEDGGSVEVSDVTFDGFRGTSSSDVAVVLDCSPGTGCTGISLSNINMKSDQGHTLTAECTNAHGKSSATSPAVTCLSP